MPSLKNVPKSSSCAGDIASPGVAERLVAAAEETGLAVAGSRARGGRDRRPDRGRPSAGTAWNECGRPRRPAHCGCTQPRPTDSSTGGLASLRWRRCWARRGRRRTPARTRGSTPWWRGDAHRVCPPPRSTGASGRTSGIEPLADLQRSRPDHSCRRHRGAGVAGGRQPRLGWVSHGCASIAPRRDPRIPRTRLLRNGASGSSTR